MSDSIAMPWDTPQVTRCGRIKIGCLGEKRLKKSARSKARNRLTDEDYWQAPVKLDRILVTHDHRDESGNFAINEQVMGALGGTRDTPLTELPVEVHSDHIPDVLACRLARYVGRKQLACSGDGKTARERVGQSDEWRERECPCEKSTLVNEGGDCKPNAIFACSLRVPGHRVIGAVYEFRTTSVISIERLTGSLRTVQQAVGTLRGVPLTLALRSVGLSAGKAPVYCMHAELREHSVEEVMQTALGMIRSRNAIIQGSGRVPEGFRALPPGSESDEEAAMVAQEFYPTEVTQLANDTSLTSVLVEPEPDEEPADDDPADDQAEYDALRKELQTLTEQVSERYGLDMGQAAGKVVRDSGVALDGPPDIDQTRSLIKTAMILVAAVADGDEAL